MSLISCPSCGNDVSEFAENCPQCRTPNTNRKDASLANGQETAEITAELKEAMDRILEAKKRSFTFMLAGRTGVGKSSTINSILRKEVAPVGSLRPTTFNVTRFPTKLGEFSFDVVDTPGLCDGLDDEDGIDRDSMYLDKMRTVAKQIDSLWFVTKLNETRVSRDEKDAIRLISKAFTPSIWKHSIIVFTYANSADIGLPYSEWLDERSKLIREEICKHAGSEISSLIPCVAIDNKSPNTPDGKPWRGELLTRTFETASKEGLLSLTLGAMSLIRRRDEPESVHAQDVKPDAWRSAPIELTTQQESRIGSRIKSDDTAKRVISGAAIGATYGTFVAGPVGTVVGGAVGAAIGYISKWFK